MKFFEEQREGSEVKTAIVTKYFDAWSRVMINKSRAIKLAYVDLYCGPGRFRDGTKSTPLIILEKAINDPDLQQRLTTAFNDADNNIAKNLETEIRGLPGIEKLKYPPVIYARSVDDKMTQELEKKSHVPSLFFIDPFGYKGLSLRLIDLAVRDWGCDCIFFFNFSRINAGITNKSVQDDLNALFGRELADELRIKVAFLSPGDREATILNAISEAIQAKGKRYLLPFNFVRPGGKRTSHHLIFVSKSPLAYTIMKDVMAGMSSTEEDGVPSFSFRTIDPQLSFLFAYSRSVENLIEELRLDFSGKTIGPRDLFDSHHIGRPYIRANYNEALRRMEKRGLAMIDPPPTKRQKRHGVVTVGDKCRITFSKRSDGQ